MDLLLITGLDGSFVNETFIMDLLLMRETSLSTTTQTHYFHTLHPKYTTMYRMSIMDILDPFTMKNVIIYEKG